MRDRGSRPGQGEIQSDSPARAISRGARGFAVTLFQDAEDALGVVACLVDDKSKQHIDPIDPELAKSECAESLGDRHEWASASVDTPTH